jgi:hypothetical protein
MFMASLKETLIEYGARPIGSMGGDETAETQLLPPNTKTFERDNFLREIKQIRKNNEIYFWICIGMAVVLFIVTIVVVFNNSASSDLIKVATAGLGATTAGVLAFTVKMVRTKGNIETLLALAPEVNDDLLKMIIEILGRRL